MMTGRGLSEGGMDMTSKRSRKNIIKYQPKDPEFRPNNIRKLRMKAGLTQEQLAEKVGAHRTTITNLERDGHRPAHPLACSLAEFFGVSVGYVKGDEEDSIYTRLSDRTPEMPGLYVVWRKGRGPACTPALAWYDLKEFLFVDKDLNMDGVVDRVEYYLHLESAPLAPSPRTCSKARIS